MNDDRQPESDTWITAEQWERAGWLSLGGIVELAAPGELGGSAPAAGCPCGARPDPRLGGYCGDDCVPTHVTADTEPRYTDVPATAMRWRPDLVSEIDDTGLTGRVARRRVGSAWVEVFDRAGTDAPTIHVRVDDGERWVGADMPVEPTDTFEQRYRDKLRALLKELGNPRHMVPAQAELDAYQRAMAAMAAVRVIPLDDLPASIAEMADGMRLLGERLRAPWRMIRSSAEHAAQNRQRDHVRWVRHPARDGEPRPEQPEPVRDERAALLRRVRAARNSGPERQQRRPQRIDPTGGR